MNSTKLPKELRAEKTAKEPAPDRRSVLRMGALGAAAVLAGGVLAGTKLEAVAQGNRQARKMRSLGAVHTSAEGRAARKSGAVRASGELGKPATSGTRSQRTATRAAPKATKAAKSSDGTRSARRMARTATQKSTKTTAQ
jgi:hypothetical protein